MNFSQLYENALKESPNKYRAAFSALSIMTEGKCKEWKKDKLKEALKRLVMVHEVKGSLNVNEENLNETKNSDVIEKFVSFDFPKSQDDMSNYGYGSRSRFKDTWGTRNLKITQADGGWALVNYSTPIAYIPDDQSVIYIDSAKYSVTTSKIQNVLKREAKYEFSEDQIKMVDPNEMGRISGIRRGRKFTGEGLNETGEWDDDDESLVAWKHSLENDMKELERLTNGKLELVDVRGFDKYQGPYANVKINNKNYEIWTTEEDTYWIENFPIDNTSKRGLSNGFEGDLYDLKDAILGEGLNERSEDFAGWIAIYKGKRLEITKDEADSLWDAKKLAIKKLKVPKSKVGLLAIAPAVNESIGESENPCWKGYKQLGMKTKNGKKVPNCIKESKGGSQVNASNLVDYIMDYESGNLDTEGVLNLFSHLIKSGRAWTLQGSYGRTAQSLIDGGYIDDSGEINWEAVDQAMMGEIVSHRSKQKIAESMRDKLSENLKRLQNTDHNLQRAIREEYNGWKNRETWNVSLWINNDEGLYRSAVDFMQNYTGDNPYRDFIQSIGLANAKTQDRVQYLSNKLDYQALDDMMREMV